MSYCFGVLAAWDALSELKNAQQTWEHLPILQCCEVMLYLCSDDLLEQFFGFLRSEIQINRSESGLNLNLS